MFVAPIPNKGTFWVPGKTATLGNAIAIPIYPYMGGPASPPLVFTAGGSGGFGGSVMAGAPVTHLTTLVYSEGTTAHTIYIARPKNWTTFSAVAAAGQAVVSLTADPGIFSTNYKYPVNSSTLYVSTAGPVPDDGIDSGDYVMYQAADGTWVMDTAAGTYSAGTVTLTTNLPTGGVLKGGVFYLFQVPGTDKDPATNALDPAIIATASTSNVNYLSDYLAGGVAGTHGGDPLIVYSANATAAGIFNFGVGFYGSY